MKSMFKHFFLYYLTVCYISFIKCCIYNKNEVEEIQDILRNVGVISRALDSISNIEFKELDLAKGQFVYLVRIYENPGIIQEKLAEMLKIDRTSASRAISNLEKNGFILKKSDENNKKNKLLFVTKKGEDLYPFIIRENEHSNEVALKDFSETEVIKLAEMLERVKENISNDWVYVKKGNKRNY